VVYAITYHNVQTNETHTVDWFVPRTWGWSTEQVRDSFEVRHLNSNVLKIEAQPCS
jgi:hypothetical protein